MPTIAESPEAETLSQAAKKFFQPPPEPREVVHAPKETVPAPKESVAKEPEPKPAAKETKSAAAKPAEKPADEPRNEADAVFGTAPAKPAKAPPEPKDEDFETTLTKEKEGMTDKAGAKWEQLRRSEKAAKDEAKAAREELKAAAEARQEQQSGADASKLEAVTKENALLKAQLDEAEKTLSVAQVERSQKFRREVGEPMNELTKAAEEMAGRYEVSPKTILAALEEDPKTRPETLAELASDFKEPDRIELYSIAKDMDRLRRKGEAFRERAKSDLSALEQEEKEAQDRESAELRTAFSASAQRAWDEAAKSFEFLRHHEAAPEWNAALDNARAQSANYVPGEDAIADGRLAADAMQAPFLRKAIDHFKTKLAAVTEENTRLLERISKDNDLDPGLGGSRDEGDADEGAEDDGLTLGQRTKAASGRMK